MYNASLYIVQQYGFSAAFTSVSNEICIRRGKEDSGSDEAYRPLIRRSKPVLKQVKTWPARAISALQDCFECTDWNMFREAATNGKSINLEEYTTSVTSYRQVHR
ncbi:hypothetical protein QTP70_002331 [Hemibagrus guttatus]|uniref:Uncharacterized protein n=1 Tax=Hemibagrus guttatus TaxID=175788 RepID=A0AAE0Q8I4_9TELE|nr:hypothetical protein QTP70_002331 [Hemibagrus guttatus]